MTLLIVIILASILYVVLIYNTMIKMRNHVKEAWSDIDVQLKRRYNLIPNIVETIKGYATHEEGVFTKVTEARSQAINATTVQEQGAAENMLSGALKSLFAVAENYPQLRANENFLQLQNELVDTEDKIQSARRFYNGNVRDFNTKIQQFPAQIIANLFKFTAEEFFEINNDQERENVEVSFQKIAETPVAPQPTEAPITPAEPITPAPTEPVSETLTEEAPAEEVKTKEPALELPIEEAPTEPIPTPPAEETTPETPMPEETEEKKKEDEKSQA